MLYTQEAQVFALFRSPVCRADLLCCENEEDFLAKLYCIRLAFDELVQSPTNRNYFMEIARDLMSNLLQYANQNPTSFVQRLDDLVQFLEDRASWELTTKELTSRKVKVGGGRGLQWTVGGCL